ncbi:caspase family protein [Streptomyces chryseus]|uniref:Peptidase C14 caspase domain-containing protein n=1 Tax=Streptomyces chryseus TaxID=68186 RepID=A0ABQ3DQ75_9ACTN|nr:caspase family protein [Streptomyces chryseus]GHB10064.1 hypothetical protein GCM10010346_36520 [Streptomyces chryseus]
MCEHEDDVLFVHKCPTREEGNRAGIHALVIGVSSYPPLRRSRLHIPYPAKFKNIEGAAAGASHFAQLLDGGFHEPTGIPIRTVRLFLSPTQAELDRIEVPRALWQEATYDNIKNALDSWYFDCDNNTDNVALMYVAGHGIVTTGHVPFAFLGGVNEEFDPCRQTINLTVISEAMLYNKAHANIYIFDCCAGDEFPAECSRGHGLTLPLPNAGGEEFRKYTLEIMAAKVGTSAFAIDAVDGTLLSWALLPLLRTAGDLLDGFFTITRDRLDDRLLPAMQSHPFAPPMGGQEPRIRGEKPSGINRPKPPPTFPALFKLKEPCAVEFTIYEEKTGVAILEDSMNTQGEKEINLPAGSYKVDARIHSGTTIERFRFPLSLDRPSSVDVLAGEVQ